MSSLAAVWLALAPVESTSSWVSIARQSGSGVGNAGEGSDSQVVLPGYDRLGYGAHSHGIGTEFTVGADFGRCFVIGPLTAQYTPVCGLALVLRAANFKVLVRTGS